MPIAPDMDAISRNRAVRRWESALELIHAGDLIRELAQVDRVEIVDMDRYREANADWNAVQAAHRVFVHASA